MSNDHVFRDTKLDAQMSKIFLCGRKQPNFGVQCGTFVANVDTVIREQEHFDIRYIGRYYIYEFG